ncbi:MAG: U32 family peptidase [Roseburia sp.]|nr:U32 family peptidase [Roseburia sp.]
MRGTVELLAPAGNKEGFYGAIHAGADAVYLGGRAFGARAYADNFSEEEILSCLRYAHLWGRKVYLTVNTLVKEKEFQELYGYLSPLYEGGLDGVIIQDIGVLSFVRQYFPDLELHASTQMTITGALGAKLLKEMGVCRIVPARELSLEEIKELKEHSGLEVECFIHGAMCYCYSGQCLFSSILGGRSGNRGRCAQPCRLPYQVKGNGYNSGECYPLSLKDMCTLEILPQLLEAGVDSLKIEGRMKKPEYAAGVTAIYRKYIDRYYNGNRQKPEKEDMQRLAALYLRSERQDGYYFRHNGRDMLTIESPSYNGSDKALVTEIREAYINNLPKLSITGRADFEAGKPARLVFSYGTLQVEAIGERVQVACKQPISDENVRQQLSKLGDTCFCLDRLKTILDEQAFYPLKAMNELRRLAVYRLEEAILKQNGFKERREQKEGLETEIKEDALSGKPRKYSGRSLSVSVRNGHQLEAVLQWLLTRKESTVKRIYIEGELFQHKKEFVLEQCIAVKDICDCIIALPYVLRISDSDWLEEVYRAALANQDVFCGFLVRNPEELSFLKERSYAGSIYTDAGLYLWNHYSLNCLEGLEGIGDKIEGVCMPLELKAAEKRELLKYAFRYSPEQIIYGRIPMMLTANCVANSTAGCRRGTDCENGLMYLKDRYQKEFPVELHCRSCMNIIYNSVPLSLHRDLERLKKLSVLRLQFTVETAQEVLQVLDFFEQEEQGASPPYKEFTTGHEKRGVE